MVLCYRSPKELIKWLFGELKESSKIGNDCSAGARSGFLMLLWHDDECGYDNAEDEDVDAGDCDKYKVTSRVQLPAFL